MSNKRITDLTELTTPTTDDVFPVVDIATNTTTKVQLGNLPTTTAVTTALATKQDTLVSGTNIKTVNSTSLLGAGDVAVQETLVSGTNIKTLNSTSLLGSGDIVLTANPSGVSGAIQFSNGSAFASDATNLFWDDTNNRLGVGTNAPTAILQAENSTNGVLLARFKDALASTSYIDIKNDVTLTDYTGLYWGGTYKILSKQTGATFLNCANSVNFADGYATKMAVTSSEVQIGSISGAKLGIKGSGSTSATTSLLVQNSAGTELFKVNDVGDLFFNGLETSSMRIHTLGNINKGITIDNEMDMGAFSGITFKAWDGSAYSNFMRINGNTASRGLIIGGTTNNASANLQIDSTTQGFLPPRMTTTQKNAISSPATGLVVYDSTTNKLCCYNGSTWNDLF